MEGFLLKKITFQLVQEYTPVIPAGRQRQYCFKFKASLTYTGQQSYKGNPISKPTKQIRKVGIVFQAYNLSTQEAEQEICHQF